MLMGAAPLSMNMFWGASNGICGVYVYGSQQAREKERLKVGMDVYLQPKYKLSTRLDSTAPIYVPPNDRKQESLWQTGQRDLSYNFTASIKM